MKHKIKPFRGKNIDREPGTSLAKINNHLYQIERGQTFYVPAKITTYLYPGEPPDVYVEKDFSNTLPLICKCGNDSFKVFYSDDYETSITCISCGKTDVVHSG